MGPNPRKIVKLAMLILAALAFAPAAGAARPAGGNDCRTGAAVLRHRRFQDAALSVGSMPFVLERHIDWWISQKLAR